MARVVWANSDADIRMRLRLRVGFEQARLVQHYQSMGAIVRQLFGGEREHPDTDAPQPQTEEELKRMFAGVFGHVG